MSKKRIFRIIAVVLATALLVPSLVFGGGSAVKADAVSGLPKNIIIGYWHNGKWGTANGGRLKDVHPEWDVINVSFMITGGDNCTARFEADGGVYGWTASTAKTTFISDIRYLQDRGKKVQISIGGATGQVHLTTENAVNTFLSTSKALIEEYGFDGVDIDLESTSINVTGDTIGNITTTTYKGWVRIVKDYKDTFGDGFMITAAPEHPYVQMGATSTSASWGCFLPFLDAIRDELTYIHPQYYNNSINYTSNGFNFSGYNVNSLVQLSKMLINGFQTRNKGYFAGLRPDQVAIGVLSSNSTGDAGLQPIANYQAALQQLIDEYDDFRGIMAWSTNWDATPPNNNQFVTGMREVIGPPEIPPDFSVSISSTSPSGIQTETQITWTASAIGATDAEYKFDVYNGAVRVGGTDDFGVSATFSYTPYTPGTYTCKVTAKSNSQTVDATSTAITVTQAPVFPLVIESIDITPTPGQSGTQLAIVPTITGGKGLKTVSCYVFRSDGKLGYYKVGTPFAYTPYKPTSYTVIIFVRDASGTATKTRAFTVS